ncbi:MAG: Crp/Fnr family transcriptional regulator [Elainellaceae cyanobacterium]
MQATLEHLASVHVLKTLNKTELSQLQPHASIDSYREGELIIIEGDRLPTCLHAVVSGQIRVSKTATTGKETILRVLSAGDIFAAPALVGTGIAPATVTAMTACQILRVNRDALLQMIQRSPDVALRMMMVFNHRLQQLHDTVHGLVSERAIVRLARFLLYTASEVGIGESSELRVKLPHYQIARSIGITYEECVRLFKSLKSVVDYQRGGHIQILDLEALEAIASGENDRE